MFFSGYESSYNICLSIFPRHPASALFSMTALVPGGPLRVIPCTMSATEGESHVENTKGFTSRKCRERINSFPNLKKPQYIVP